ncbi:Rrf2 family transcriptional regulator [Anaerobacillus alkalidiazotrophicus]|uniref:HTH-type transcriptional regulator NsrR n=1 Tax=Anaerobacillus alkalidiazotrophicus TaxID=472963 RepID=A0A1S2MAS9_9BACI|nr:Rrf2 family transcriptional regulator [Anaerobacillus alkalidiazotrophicus]OIJ21680.1 Rrf2 family transcriptional regulator [Anaerobacillus alkalidiazotrophicus]
MQLTTYTDYSLRLLIFLGTQPEGKLSSIKEISNIYGISNNHLSKIVYELAQLGLIKTVRGRNGGIRLAKPPREINIGWVIRQTEDNLDLVECFNKEHNRCIITSACGLKHVLKEALQAYFQILDAYTLEDVIVNSGSFNTLLHSEPIEKTNS